MGRAVIEARITTRAGRTKLPVSKVPHWRAVDRGAHLGYRKGIDGGTWVARFRRPDGTYTTKAIGKADDTLEPDGYDLLDYSQALARARGWYQEQARILAGDGARSSYTVADAMRDYLEWYADHRRGLQATTYSVNAHILPKLGDVKVEKLTARDIRKWHAGLAASPARLRSGKGRPLREREPSDDAETGRKRKATANRVLTILKAALNYAYREGLVTIDDAWKRVKPFERVDQPKVRYLSQDECIRLVNACPPDFRELVKGALLTGCRYGELIALRCDDFSSASGTVLIRLTKSGKARHAFVSDEGRLFFEELTAGRPGDEIMFLRSDGKPWGRSHQQRPLTAACKRAGISPPTSFHILRHTHGSQLAMQGVPMAVIAAQLGHANTRMGERHYAHLSPSYVGATIRANLPTLGIHEAGKVVGLKRR